MKIALFGKKIADNALPFIQELTDKLQASDGITLVYQPFFENLNGRIRWEQRPDLFYNQSDIYSKADILLSIGGDGTILDALTLVGDSGIPVAGINLGRLGFLSSIPKDHILPAIDAILNRNFLLDQRTLLQLETSGKLFGEFNYALNDLTVYKSNAMTMLMIKTWINGDFLNSYWADGLIVATPTGSTAYSLSCTGPILTPDAENFVITPIASHNLTVRPIVIRDDSIIKIRVEGKCPDFLVSLDSRMERADNTMELTIRKAEFKVNLLRLPETNFFTTIREKLNWGLDIRN